MMTKNDELYMSLARLYAEESKCGRKKVGAVIVKNGLIISYGFNGVPHGLISCSTQKPCFKISNNWPSGKPVPADSNDCLAIHAEQYAIINAANHESIKSESQDWLKGATLYSTHQPCRQCALHIAAAHISRVVYENEYPDTKGVEFLGLAKIQAEKYAPTKVISPLIASNFCEVKTHA
jgi:dCMP deaminase